MTIRKKIILSFLIFLLSMFLVLVTAGNFVIIKRFLSIEDSKIKTELIRVNNIFKNELEDLDKLVLDWAIWDDTYNFMKNKNKRYLKSNINRETFINSEINFIYLIDNSFNLTYASSFDYVNEEEIKTKHFFKRYLDRWRITQTNKEKKGIVFIHDKPAFFSCRKIFHSDFSGKPAGYIIFGKFIDIYVKKFSDILQHEIKIYNPSTQGYKKISTLDFDENSFKIVKYSEEKILSYIKIRTFDNSSSIVIQVPFERDIYNQGKQTIVTLSIASLLILIIVGVIFHLVIDNQVLKRIYKLSKEVDVITKNKDHKTRIKLTGKDEITILQNDINSMLCSLEKYVQKKETLIKELEASFKELKKIQKEKIRLEKKNSVLAMAVTANHELNQPLMVMLASIEILELNLDSLSLSDNQIKHIDRIKSSLQKINHILKKYREIDSIRFADYTEATKMVIFEEDPD